MSVQCRLPQPQDGHREPKTIVNQDAASRLMRQVAAELIGTFMLVFFGCGVVHAAVLTGAQQGLWQVAIVWGV
jgi:Major intrinsic protein